MRWKTNFHLILSLKKNISYDRLIVKIKKGSDFRMIELEENIKKLQILKSKLESIGESL